MSLSVLAKAWVAYLGLLIDQPPQVLLGQNLHVTMPFQEETV